jgi:hypothetical protein
MDKVTVPRAEADFWVVKLCDEMDARHKERGNISDRFPILVLAALICLSGCSAILKGKDADLVRQFGELASVVSFGGLPFFVGWIVRDRFRLKAIPREDAATEADLASRGYEYWPGDEGRIYRLPLAS